jgi:hypothetical protein
VSDGGSGILYYIAFPLFGNSSSENHWCTSDNPGPNACHIDGLKVGKVLRQIRVRAVSAKGRGHVAIVFPVATPASGVTPTSPGSGTSQPVQPSTNAAVNTAVDTPTASGPGGATSGSDIPAELPFTGINLMTLLTLGLSLVLGGWLILNPVGARRRARLRRVPLRVIIGIPGH